MKLPRIAEVGQLIALSAEAERRAALRYRRLAERAGSEGRSDLVRLFEALAREEEAHEARVRALPEGAEAAEPGPAMVAALGAAGESAEAADLDRLSLYTCLADAVEREQTAFTLYSYLAAQATDSEVRQLAEALAKEELGHAQMLRQARRKAYHRAGPARSDWPKAGTVTSLAGLLAAARAGEARLLAALAETALPEKTRAALARMTLEALPGLPEAPGAGDRLSPDELLARAEDAFTFYDAVMERARSEDLMDQAQMLSRLALERIKRLSAAQQPSRSER